MQPTIDLKEILGVENEREMKLKNEEKSVE